MNTSERTLPLIRSLKFFDESIFEKKKLSTVYFEKDRRIYGLDDLGIYPHPFNYQLNSEKVIRSFANK